MSTHLASNLREQWSALDRAEELELNHRMTLKMQAKNRLKVLFEACDGADYREAGLKFEMNGEWEMRIIMRDQHFASWLGTDTGSLILRIEGENSASNSEATRDPAHALSVTASLTRAMVQWSNSQSPPYSG